MKIDIDTLTTDLTLQLTQRVRREIARQARHLLGRHRLAIEAGMRNDRETGECTANQRTWHVWHSPNEQTPKEGELQDVVPLAGLGPIATRHGEVVVSLDLYCYDVLPGGHRDLIENLDCTVDVKGRVTVTRQ